MDFPVEYCYRGKQRQCSFPELGLDRVSPICHNPHTHTHMRSLELD